jgi:hypothetical protein
MFIFVFIVFHQLDLKLKTSNSYFQIFGGLSAMAYNIENLLSGQQREPHTVDECCGTNCVSM